MISGSLKETRIVSQSIVNHQIDNIVKFIDTNVGLISIVFYSVYLLMHVLFSSY